MKRQYNFARLKPIRLARNQYTMSLKTLKGVKTMRDSNFGVDTVLNFAGFAAAGVAAYSAFDGKWKITAIAAGAGLLCLYGAVQILKDRLNEKKKEEDFDTIWRENDHVHERINKLEDRLDTVMNNGVSTNTFDGAIQDLHQKIDNNSDNTSRDFDAVYRHIGDEMREVNYRIDSVDIGTACSGKRSK